MIIRSEPHGSSVIDVLDSNTGYAPMRPSLRILQTDRDCPALVQERRVSLEKKKMKGGEESKGNGMGHFS